MVLNVKRAERSAAKSAMICHVLTQQVKCFGHLLRSLSVFQMIRHLIQLAKRAIDLRGIDLRLAAGVACHALAHAIVCAKRFGCSS